MVSGTQTQSEAAEKREALSARETTALPAEKKKVIAETDLSKRQVPVNVTSLAVGIRDGKEQEGISTGGNKNNVDGQMTISMPTGSTDKGNSTGEITDSSSAWPRYKANDQPSYPLFARLRGYEGTVLLSVEVLSSGLVGRMKVKASSGYESLDQSALSALEKWIFEPARQKGNPIAMWVDVPVRFSLRSRGNI
jgi:TonB family protein